MSASSWQLARRGHGAAAQSAGAPSKTSAKDLPWIRSVSHGYGRAAGPSRSFIRRQARSTPAAVQAVTPVALLRSSTVRGETVRRRPTAPDRSNVPEGHAVLTAPRPDRVDPSIDHARDLADVAGLDDDIEDGRGDVLHKIALLVRHTSILAAHRRSGRRLSGRTGRRHDRAFRLACRAPAASRLAQRRPSTYRPSAEPASAGAPRACRASKMASAGRPPNRARTYALTALARRKAAA